VTKYLKSFLVVLLALAVASPALAELKVSGYYRLQGIATNSDDTSVRFDGPNSIEPSTKSLIDQRLRLKVDNTLNEYVTVTWFGEVDGTWGSADGGPGGDRISVETKNAYLDFKIPNSIFSVRTGLQGIGGRYQGVLLADDWSAAQVGMKFTDAINLVLLYSKPIEGNQATWDDVDFYNAQLDVKTGVVNLGFDLAWLDNNNYDNGSYSATNPQTAAGAGDSPLFFNDKPFNLYFAGVKADAKVGPVAVNGFFLYAFGSEDNPTGDLTPEMDISAFATSVAAKVKVDIVDLGARAIYMSGDSDQTDNDIESFVPNLGGNYDFTGENLMIFLTDAYYNNGPGGRLATNAATVDGVGLIGLTGQANVTLGQFYAKLGLGYFMAADTPAGVDDQMGFEGALRVGTKIAEKVDFSINGAYALLGDYWKQHYNGTTDTVITLTDTPDDIWKAVAMLNVGF
jgi:hypothetical protein